MLEFVFEETPWEQELGKLQPGENMSALRLLTLLEEADEDTAQEALDAMAEKQISLDISDLPEIPSSGNLALRLRQEAQLAAGGDLPKTAAVNIAQYQECWEGYARDYDAIIHLNIQNNQVY